MAPDYEHEFCRGRSCRSWFQNSEIDFNEEAFHGRVSDKRQKLVLVADVKAAIELCLGWTANSLIVDKDFKFRTKMLEDSDKFLLTWSFFNDQTGRNDMLYRPGKSPIDFRILKRPNERNIYLCMCCQYYMQYENNESFRSLLFR